MVSFTILAGGIGPIVASYLFDSDANSFELMHKIPTGLNNTWLARNPQNTSILYAVNDSEEGAIQSFTIGHEGLLLGPLSTAVTGGSYPSHIQPLSSGEDLFITNPDSGTVRILHLDTDPTEFNEESSVTLALPSGAKPEQAVEGSSGEIYVVDSGTDVSWVFSKADNGSWTITDALVSASGSHPHRAAVNTHTPPLKSQPARLPSHAAQGRFVFTLHDDLTVTTHDLHADDPNEPVSTVSIMPSGVEGAVFEAGELLAPDVSDKFPGRFVYCSSINSRTNPKGDIISILSVSDDGSLTLVNQVLTGLQGPRGMAFSGSTVHSEFVPLDAHGAGDAEYLVVGGAGDDVAGAVAVFRRVERGENLQLVAREEGVPGRASFLWV